MCTKHTIIDLSITMFCTCPGALFVGGGAQLEEIRYVHTPQEGLHRRASIRILVKVWVKIVYLGSQETKFLSGVVCLEVYVTIDQDMVASIGRGGIMPSGLLWKEIQ